MRPPLTFAPPNPDTSRPVMALPDSFDFRSPTRVVHGAGSVARVPELLPEGEKVLVVSDRGLEQAGVVERVTSTLDDAGVAWTPFTDVTANPVARNVSSGARVYKRGAAEPSSASAAARPWTWPR